MAQAISSNNVRTATDELSSTPESRHNTLLNVVVKPLAQAALPVCAWNNLRNYYGYRKSGVT
jgi:hypothetical protein